MYRRRSYLALLVTGGITGCLRFQNSQPSPPAGTPTPTKTPQTTVPTKPSTPSETPTESQPDTQTPAYVGCFYTVEFDFTEVVTITDESGTEQSVAFACYGLTVFGQGKELLAYDFGNPDKEPLFLYGAGIYGTEETRNGNTFKWLGGPVGRVQFRIGPLDPEITPQVLQFRGDAI